MYIAHFVVWRVEIDTLLLYLSSDCLNIRRVLPGSGSYMCAQTTIDVICDRTRLRREPPDKKALCIMTHQQPQLVLLRFVTSFNY